VTTPPDLPAIRRLTEALEAHRGDAAAYRRLAGQLRARRIALDPRYGNRALFVRERGEPVGLNAKYAFDLESDKGSTYGREGFKPGKMLAAAQAYAVTPASVAAVLDGTGDLAALAGAAPAAPGPQLPVAPHLEAPAREHLREIAGRLEVLRAAGITGPSGRQVFPAGGPDAADWDTFTAEGFTPAEAAAMIAAVRVRAAAALQEHGAI
jgi:hypothetical protein